MITCAITGSRGILGRRIKKFLPFKFYEFKKDITDYPAVKKWVAKRDFDIVIHLAAIVPTNKVEKNYIKANNVNFSGTKNLVSAILNKKNKPKWFFFSSTSHVYKPTFKFKKIKENSKTLPYSKYGITKLNAEKYIKKKLKKKVKFCIGRIFSFTDKFQKSPFVVPEIIKKINVANQNKIVLKNLNHYRDFLSTKDIVNAIFKLYRLRVSGIYNIGSGKKICLKEIAELLGAKHRKEIFYIDNKKPTFLISNNKKLLKLKFKFRKYKKTLNYFY